MPLKPLTRTVSQQSTVPAGGQSVTQGSTSTPNNEQSWRTAREALKTGFEAAVIVVEGLEIPSAKEAFRGVILILERIAVRVLFAFCSKSSSAENNQIICLLDRGGKC